MDTQNDQNQKNLLLVVEDEDDLRSLYVEGLSLVGAEVLQAKDGQEGWEVFQEHLNDIDAVVSDVFMPRMNGIELLNKIKEARAEVPVMLVTAYAHRHKHQLEHECIHPPDAFLEKPFHLSKLLEMLSDILPGNSLSSL